MATSECRHPPLKALLLRLREAVEIKRVAASSLHRTIETGTTIDSIAKASVETITPIVADPEWIVEAIGEVAAITPVETVAVPENLSTEVQRSTHWDRKQSARALGVAIAVMNNTISNPLESLVGDRVPFAAHPQSTDYILGEVAAADPDAFSSVPRPIITQIRSSEGGNTEAIGRSDWSLAL
jgi:hypothetical protein